MAKASAKGRNRNDKKKHEIANKCKRDRRTTRPKIPGCPHVCARARHKLGRTKRIGVKNRTKTTIIKGNAAPIIFTNASDSGAMTQKPTISKMPKRVVSRESVISSWVRSQPTHQGMFLCIVHPYRCRFGAWFQCRHQGAPSGCHRRARPRMPPTPL